MTLSLSPTILKNWLLSSLTLSVLCAATPSHAQPGTCRGQQPTHYAQQMAAKSRYRAAIRCLRGYTKAKPHDLDARAQLIRIHAWQKDYPAARKELASSPLKGTVTGEELAGDIAWYEGAAPEAAGHYRNALTTLSRQKPGALTETTKARLWDKTIQAHSAGGDDAGAQDAVTKAKVLLSAYPQARGSAPSSTPVPPPATPLPAGPNKALATALTKLRTRVAAYKPQQVTAPDLATVKSAPTGSGLGYQVAVGSEFVFVDRYSDKGYSRTFAGQGGLKGRNVSALGTIRMGQQPLYQLDLLAERRERFFGVGAEPINLVGGFGLSLGIGEPRHTISLQLLWTAPAEVLFTYHNQFTLGYSLPIAVGSVDFGLRHTRYQLSSTDRLTIGLSYYSGTWLWLPKVHGSYTRYVRATDPNLYTSGEVKGVWSPRSPYQVQGWVSGGEGEANLPTPGLTTERVAFIAYGLGVQRSFAASTLLAGLTMGRHNEPRYHENTIGLNLSWRRF